MSSRAWRGNLGIITLHFVSFASDSKYMNIEDLLKDAINLTDKEFEIRLNSLVRENHSFRNLDYENKKVVVEIFRRFKSRLRRGMGISNRAVRNESRKLYRKREELNLTEADLNDIKKIMRGFQGKKEQNRKSMFWWLGF